MTSISIPDGVLEDVADFTLSAMPADVDWGQRELHVSVEHRVDGRSLVALWEEQGDGTEIELTSGEGRQVAIAVLAACDQADGIKPAGPCSGGVSWCADGQHTGEHTATAGVVPVSLWGEQLAVTLVQDGAEPLVSIEQVGGVEAATLTLDEATQHALAVLRAVALAGGGTK